MKKTVLIAVVSCVLLLTGCAFFTPPAPTPEPTPTSMPGYAGSWNETEYAAYDKAMAYIPVYFRNVRPGEAYSVQFDPTAAVGIEGIECYLVNGSIGDEPIFHVAVTTDRQKVYAKKAEDESFVLLDCPDYSQPDWSKFFTAAVSADPEKDVEDPDDSYPDEDALNAFDDIEGLDEAFIDDTKAADYLEYMQRRYQKDAEDYGYNPDFVKIVRVHLETIGEKTCFVFEAEIFDLDEESSFEIPARAITPEGIPEYFFNPELEEWLEDTPE